MSAFSGYVNMANGNVNESAVLDIEISENCENAIFEQMLIEECSHFTDEQLSMFLESDLCQELVTEGKMRKNTIVLLSKKDDMNRRNMIIAIQMAKDAGDPLYDKLKKTHTIERNLEAKIMQKYGRKAQKTAKVQQKDWIKNRMPANFGKFGGADRVSNDAQSTKPFERKYGIK